MSETLLKVDDLRVSFDTYAGEVRAVRGVSFRVDKGETLAIVGESGSGKSVTAQSVMRLSSDKTVRYKTGTIDFNGRLILELTEKELCKIRGSEIGMILQDPLTSLNPTMTVGKQIAESIIKHQKLKKSEAIEKSIEMLRTVGIPEPEKRVRQYPHEFSGGQRQRIAIARALVTDPQLLLCDEPVSALDVSIQAQILNLLKDLQEKKKLTYVFVSHDMSVISHISDRVLVMYLGQAVELAEKEDLFEHPLHPYTQALMQAVPIPDPREQDQCKVLEGEIPSPMDLPSGCPFCARCKKALAICKEIRPQMAETADGHQVACHLYTDGGKQ